MLKLNSSFIKQLLLISIGPRPLLSMCIYNLKTRKSCVLVYGELYIKKKKCMDPGSIAYLGVLGLAVWCSAAYWN